MEDITVDDVVLADENPGCRCRAGWSSAQRANMGASKTGTARKEAGRVVLRSRHGTDFTDKLPRIAAAVRSLPVENGLLDGEAVAFRPDGHSDFEALRTKRGAAEAAFVAFDLLQINGENRRKLPLEVRRAELAMLVAGIDAISFSEAIETEGALVFAKACELGLEGIVSKRVGGAYWSGRCRNWLKVKKSGLPGR